MEFWSIISTITRLHFVHVCHSDCKIFFVVFPNLADQLNVTIVGGLVVMLTLDPKSQQK